MKNTLTNTLKTKHNRAFQIIAASVLLATPGCETRNNEGRPSEHKEKIAQEASMQAPLESVHSWLALLDQGNYVATYEQTSSRMKELVQPQQWFTGMNAVRKPLGAAKSRTFKEQQYTTSLPNKPDGKYWVVKLDTDFEHRPSSTETITVKHAEDGQWRVAGYIIK